MELLKQEQAALTTYSGQEVRTIQAGSGLKFKERGSEGHFLDVTVPEGKKWTATTTVQIVETDAV